MKHLLLFLFILSTGFTQTPKPFPQGIKTKLVQNDTQTLTIATGAVTANSGSLILAAETGTADDLDTINGLKVNQTIILRPDAGDTITLKHGTGNIITNDGADVTLNPDGAATGIYDGTNIRIASGGGGGGGGGDVSSSIGSSTDNAISVFDGTGGKTIKQPTTDINALTQKIINVVDPTADQHAATKKFVDDGFQPLDGVLTDLAGIALVQGDIVYYNGTNLVRLAPGTTGQFLKTLGAAANPIWDTAAGGGGATTALDNLAAVAINTSLISDTDATDDIGSLAIRWTNIFAQNMNTGDTAADELKLQAYDVDGASFTTFATLTANNTPTMSLSGDITSVTQVPSDNSLKLATTAYVDLAILAGGTTAQKEIGVALSNETSDLTVGVAKITFRMPIDMTLTGVRANVNTAPTGSSITVDINKTGVGSLLSTLLTIDATELTSETASVPAVISTSALLSDDEITIDIDIIGSTIAGKGLKIWLIGTVPATGSGNGAWEQVAVIDQTIAGASIDLSDVFTDDYECYQIKLIGLKNSVDSTTLLRVEQASSFKSDANYNFRNDNLDSNSGTYSGTGTNNATSFTIGDIDDTEFTDGDIYWNRPRAITEKNLRWNLINPQTGRALGKTGIGNYNGSTAICTGFQILPSSGNITGKIVVLGYNPTGGGSSGSTDGWQNIGSEVSASGDALLEFDVSDTDFRQYRLIVNGITPSTNGVEIHCQAFIGSYITTGYKYHSRNSVNGSTSYFATSPSTDSEFMISNAMGTATGEGADFKLNIFNPASTTQNKRFTAYGVLTDASPDMRVIDAMCDVGNTGAMTKFKIFMSSGNIALGSFQLQGFKTTP